MRDDIVVRAKRRIEPGEYVTDDDVDILPGGTTVINVPHEDLDVKVVVPPDFTLSEVGAAMRQLQSPTSITVPLEIPSHIRTMGDFFDEGPGGMGAAIANQLADRLYGPDACSRCGVGGVKTTEKFPGRKLCVDCFPIEY